MVAALAIQRHEFIKGIDSVLLFKLLWQNRLRVSPKYFGSLVNISLISFISSAFNFFESSYNKRIEATQITEDPIIILGHWRSGTSYLHKLLSLDPQNTTPTVFQCTFPKCFITAEDILSSKLAAALPTHRPFDNVKMGVNEPFEDEFALLKMTLISPMLAMVFPGSQSLYETYYDIQLLTSQELDLWKDKLIWFLKKISFLNNKRIVLKSPTHSFRVNLLLGMFPKARFICMHRNPYSVYSSTIHLWKKLLSNNKLQDFKISDLHELVSARYMNLFYSLESAKEYIPERQYHKLRFEDLEKNPIKTMGRLYEQLDLGDFVSLKSIIETYIREQGVYKKNTFSLTEKEKKVIAKCWKPAFQVYGYQK